MKNFQVATPINPLDEDQLANITRDAILYIKKQQEPDGSFISFSSSIPTDFAAAVPYRTTFFTSIIMACVNSIQRSNIATGEVASLMQVVQESAARFLLKEKSEDWSWNYWAHEAKERITMPYPDDLDDTVCALAALQEFDPNILGGKTLAAIIKILVSLEMKEGGPYQTWIISGNANPIWKDVDLAVNSNVAWFLSLIGIRLPHLEEMANNAIRERSLISRYYPGPIHVVYFISRFYRGPWCRKLAQIILQHFDLEITPLERAMAVSALINIGSIAHLAPSHLSPLLDVIHESACKPYAFCLDPRRDRKTCYAGASVLTMAFCAEAITKYATANKNIRPSYPATKQTVHTEILNAARMQCSTAGKALQATVCNEIEKTTDTTITSLAYHFSSILEAHGHHVSRDIVRKLSLANLYGWIAYRIYDDIEDQEGDPLLLPAANFFLHALCDIYHNLEDKIPGAWNMLQDTLHIVDHANAWEFLHCRADSPQLPDFADYENLAERSIAHALGPMIELLVADYAPNSKEQNAVLTFSNIISLHDN